MNLEKAYSILAALSDQLTENENEKAALIVGDAQCAIARMIEIKNRWIPPSQGE